MKEKGSCLYGLWQIELGQYFFLVDLLDILHVHLRLHCLILFSLNFDIGYTVERWSQSCNWIKQKIKWTTIPYFLPVMLFIKGSFSKFKFMCFVFHYSASFLWLEDSNLISFLLSCRHMFPCCTSGNLQTSI